MEVKVRLSSMPPLIKLAGEEGFEPSLHGPEPCVLPLDDSPARFRLAEEFISKLPIKPLVWYVGGSTARGDFRPDSDIDVFALFEKDIDVPLFSNEELGLIDFHYFASDWAVYKANPKLLEQWFISSNDTVTKAREKQAIPQKAAKTVKLIQSQLYSFHQNIIPPTPPEINSPATIKGTGAPLTFLKPSPTKMLSGGGLC